MSVCAGCLAWLWRITLRPMSTPDSNAPSRTGTLTISGFQRFIFDKYYATDSARGTPPTFMWFIEEIGELSTALANNAPGKQPTAEQRGNLEEEFADVFAWLCTLANINNVDLAAALDKYLVKGVEGVKS